MSDWSKIAGFGSGVTLNESTFANTVGGGKFLTVGVHENMTITEVELKFGKTSGNPYLRFRIENDEGAGINHNVMINGKPDDEGNARFHWAYTGIGNALLASDLALALKFFGETLPAKPELFDALVGLKLNIKIDYGKDGYIVKDVPTGGKQLIDIETDQPFEGSEVYADFTECKEAAEELGIKRCWNQVSRVFSASAEDQKKNVEVIKKVSEGGVTKKKKSKIVSL